MEAIRACPFRQKHSGSSFHGQNCLAFFADSPNPRVSQFVNMEPHNDSEGEHGSSILRGLLRADVQASPQWRRLRATGLHALL